MIRSTWHAELAGEDAAGVADLLAESVAYDEEAGFSTVGSGATAATRHGLVRLLPRGDRGDARLETYPDDFVIAYLRLDPAADGWTSVQFVVRPALRSLGVATLMFERLARPEDEEPGWTELGVTQVSGWSHGRHPAAERMANRFGATRDRDIHKVLRLVGGRTPFKPTTEPTVERADAPDGGVDVVGPEHAAGLAPADRAILARPGALLLVSAGGRRLGSVVTVPASGRGPALLAIAERLDPGGARPLLEAGLVSLQDSGARLVLSYVDSDDATLLRASREMGFVHDQSDVRYRLDLAPARRDPGTRDLDHETP